MPASIPANVSLAKKASSKNKYKKKRATPTTHETVVIDPSNANVPTKNQPYYVQ